MQVRLKPDRGLGAEVGKRGVGAVVVLNLGLEEFGGGERVAECVVWAIERQAVAAAGVGQPN